MSTTPFMFEKRTILNEVNDDEEDEYDLQKGVEEKLQDDQPENENIGLTTNEEDLNLFSDETEETDQPERGQWTNKLEFLFTCIGYAVGLGNIWRFPYLCYKNGGGAFIIPYFIMLLLIGLPIFFLELSFGQFASLGPLTIWKINPLLKGIGYATVATVWLFDIYYNVIVSHILFFLCASLRAIFSGIPWDSCNNEWNTPYCIDSQHNSSTFNYNSNMTNSTNSSSPIVAALVQAPQNLTNNETVSYRTAAQEYYNIYVLQKSSGIDDIGSVNWRLCLLLLFAWIIVLICLIRGVQSLGRVVYFTALFPYVMLTILLIRGVTLKGASQGIIFYLKPKFSELLNAKVWCEAAAQIFYSLSCCTGGLIAMSSFNKFKQNCLKDALIVAFINCLTSFYAGFVIFSVLGFMAYEKGVPVSKVAVGGPGLAFEVYPEAIARMPVPALWAILFFLMMATLGFGSQFSQVECFICAFTDEWAHIIRKSTATSILFRIVVMTKFFLLGIPMVTYGGMYLINLVDTNAGGFPLLVIGFCEVIAINWIYGYDFFSKDIKLMLGKVPGIYWKVTWKFVTPLIIFLTILFNSISYKDMKLGDYEYPQWAIVLGWLVALFPISMIPFFFLYRYCTEGGFHLVQVLMKPAVDWGPAKSSDRTGRYAKDKQYSSIFKDGTSAVVKIPLNETRQELSSSPKETDDKPEERPLKEINTNYSMA